MGYPADVDHRINTSAVTADDDYYTRQGEFDVSARVNVLAFHMDSIDRLRQPAHFPGRPRGRLG